MRLKDETYEYIKQVVIDNFIYYKIRGIPINPFEIDYFASGAPELSFA